jgi:Putative ER transporter, 6TM, N-terminal
MFESLRQNSGLDGHSSARSAEDAATPGKGATVSKTRRKLPGWLDHFNARDLKVLFRCSVAAWVASLLIFIGPSLREIGTATFFAT